MTDGSFICVLQNLGELEKRLISLNSHDENSVRSAIEEFSSEVQLDEDSVLKRFEWNRRTISFSY